MTLYRHQFLYLVAFSVLNVARITPGNVVLSFLIKVSLHFIHFSILKCCDDGVVY